MRVQVFEGPVGDSVTTSTYEVQQGTGVVFLTPSVINPVCYARFTDAADKTHQIPVAQLVNIDPS